MSCNGSYEGGTQSSVPLVDNENSDPLPPNKTTHFLGKFYRTISFFRFPPAAGGGGALAPIRGNLLCLHLLSWAPPL